MIQFDMFLQTGYSFNGSLLDIERTVKQAKKQGYKSLGIADYKNLYGIVKFYLSCVKHEIKPIIGMQISVKNADSSNSLFLVYAKNNNGMNNLIGLSSYIRLNNNQIMLDKLTDFQEDLIIVLQTHQGSFFQAMMEENMVYAHELIVSYQSMFDCFYIGVDFNYFDVELKIAPAIKNFGKVIITTQVSYLNTQDRYASSVLKEILKDQKQIEEGLFEHPEIYFDLKSLESLNEYYHDYQDYIDETNNLIDTIDVSFDFSNRHLPVYPVPNQYPAYDYLRALAEKGLEKRYFSSAKKHSYESYQKRLAYELSIIHQMGYDDYFLIVWDFVLYAKKHQILVGPGRGSAAGSLVSYVLGIVDVDPIEFNLYFERFLNPERITMPDIDMDFPDDKRDDVIQYVVNKYGKEHVTSIITFGTFQGKSALRDCARVLGIDETVISEVSTYVGESDNSIEEFAKENPDKYKYLMTIPDINKMFDVASKLIGLPKHISTHAAGIIFTDKKITDYVPIQLGLAGLYQTQYEAQDLEMLGLLKIDFLGLRNLTTIRSVIERIEADSNQKFDIYKIPLDDSKTYELLKNVSTLGVFQLESKGMMSLLKRMQVSNFEDISTCIALFRPGPMDNIPVFLKRRNKEEAIKYSHPDLEAILKSTEGIIVYQEQIMQIANQFAGYSLGEADVLRRAVSKKKESVLLQERQRFVEKCTARNHRVEVSNEIYDYIVKFANYGFNKSHSVAYSLVAYWMAYLKANYPKYFMAVLLDSSIGSQRATVDYIRESQKLGIKILPPRINSSLVRYRLVGENLRFPLLGIRNIGSVIANKIEEVQAQGMFTSYIDFISRAKDVNNRVLESMILVGMFDDFGQTKRTLIENTRQIQSFLNLGKIANEEDFVYIHYDEYDLNYLLTQEKELLGLNLSYHLISSYLEDVNQKKVPLVSEILDHDLGSVRFAGILSRIKEITTKNGSKMAFVAFEDTYGTIDCVVFPEVYLELKDYLVLNQGYYVFGTSEERQNQKQVIIKGLEKIKG